MNKICLWFKYDAVERKAWQSGGFNWSSSFVPDLFWNQSQGSLFLRLGGRNSSTCLTSHRNCVKIRWDAVCKCFINRRSSQVYKWLLNHTFGPLSTTLLGLRALNQRVSKSTTPRLLEMLECLPNKDEHSVLQSFVQEHERGYVRETVSAGFLPIKGSPIPRPGHPFLNSHSEILKAHTFFFFLKNLSLIGLLVNIF